MRKLLLSLFLFCVVLTASVALTGRSIAEESWGAVMFPTKHHDFGRVALGANAEFRFELANIYDREVKLVNVRSSCGCTSATSATPLLKPGEAGTILVRLNTSGQYLREKSAVLSVQLETNINGARRMDTVQLFVSGYIRPDVVLTPGSVEFGAVSEGATARRTLQLEYTGRPGWALVKVERSQSFIHAQAEEIRRDRGEATYRLTVTLKENAPIGYVKDILRFTTTELQPGRTEPVEIVLPVQGVVVASLRAKPSPMSMGVLMPGETVGKNIVIRSDTPFQITNITASDPRFRFAFPDQESTVQIVSVSFSAGQIAAEQSRDITDLIRISTNDPRQQSITIPSFVQIMSAL
jgi:hypothetical protein